jgi:tryptophan synthase alpha chain
MNQITKIFNQSGHKALIPYVTVGYPSIETTLKVVPMLSKYGCDMIELGIPFSDPLADGVTIQKASFSALEKGVTPDICLKVARELSQTVNIPLIFMTYYNPIYNYGLNEFCKDCNKSGIKGLIIPDLPPDEVDELETITQKQGIDLIYLLSPTSTEARIKLVAEKSRGYIYLVSVTGVTGARSILPKDLDIFIRRVRQETDKPLCVGFGISTPDQAKQIAQIADGVIVGSRVIQLIETDDSLESVGDFIRSLRFALDDSN